MAERRTPRPDSDGGAGRGMREPTEQDKKAAADVTDVVNTLRTSFADRDKVIHDTQAVVFGEMEPEIPVNYQGTAEVVKSPLAIHISNTIVAALSVNPFTVQFQPVGMGDTAQINSTRREHFFEASWARQEQDARTRLFREFMWNAAILGTGVLKKMERSKRAWAGYDRYQKKLMARLNDRDDEEYGEIVRADDQDSKDRIYDARTEEYKRKAPYPITTEVILPETFYFLKSNDGFTFCSEVKQVPYVEALATYHAGLGKGGRVVTRGQERYDSSAMMLPQEQWASAMSGERTLTLVHAWDCEYVTSILIGPGQTSSQSATLGSGTVVQRIKHGYGDKHTGTLRGPYFLSQGLTTGSRLPHRAGLGVLYGFLPLFPLLDRLLTISGHNAYMTGYAAFKRQTPPGMLVPDAGYGREGTESTADEHITPGMIYPYDIGPVEQPKAGEALERMIGTCRSLLELALPSVVQGVISGDQSGYALNQAAYLARLSWNPIVDNAQTCLGEQTGFESWLIEHRVQENVYAWGEPVARGNRRGGKAGWLRMGPDDLDGIHRYTCRLDPETPSNEVVELRAIAEALKLGVMTHTQAIERVGRNPDEVERGLLVEELKRDPAIIGKVRENVLARLGTIEAKRMPEGIPGPDGLPLQPGQPPQPQPGMGMPNGDAIGQVFAPGQGMPLIPTPPGAVTGASGLPPGIAGAIPGPPPNHQPLPGGGPF